MKQGPLTSQLGRRCLVPLISVIALLLLTQSAAAVVSLVLTAETLPASNVTTNSADLNGSITVYGEPSSVMYYFEYGTDTSYGSQTDFKDAGTASTEVSDGITGLEPGTTYHYRVVALYMVGYGPCIEVYGDDEQFTTGSEPTDDDDTPDENDNPDDDDVPVDETGDDGDTTDTTTESVVAPTDSSGTTTEGTTTGGNEENAAQQDGSTSSTSDSSTATAASTTVQATSAEAVPVVTTQSAARCSGLRLFKIRIRNLKGGVRVVSAKVRVDGKTIKAKKDGKRLIAMIDLRGRIRETVKIKITARTSTGRTVRGVRIYHPCRPFLSDTPPYPL